jgi:hypothetical protein
MGLSIPFLNAYAMLREVWMVWNLIFQEFWGALDKHGIGGYVISSFKDYNFILKRLFIWLFIFHHLLLHYFVVVAIVF